MGHLGLPSLLRLLLAPILLLLVAAVPAHRPMKAPRAPGHITVDAWQADVRHVLQLLADVGERNLVLDDSVKGKITVKLDGVSWRAALIAVIRTHGLAYLEDGTVLFVAPREKLAALADVDDSVLASLQP